MMDRYAGIGRLNEFSGFLYAYEYKKYTRRQYSRKLSD